MPVVGSFLYDTYLYFPYLRTLQHEGRESMIVTELPIKTSSSHATKFTT